MNLPAPYWQGDGVTLYCADALRLLPILKADAIVTDPPYGVTGLAWDLWPAAWPAAAANAAPQMWCFGSFRMFFERQAEFAAWSYAQEIVWQKHNGTSLHNDVHPTQKPDAIVTPLILYSTPPGGIILDPFAGSGTTLVVARRHGLRAIGIEAREEYCRTIVDRLAQRELVA